MPVYNVLCKSFETIFYQGQYKMQIKLAQPSNKTTPNINNE